MVVISTPPPFIKPTRLVCCQKERKYCRIYYLLKSRKFGDYIINKNGLSGRT